MSIRPLIKIHGGSYYYKDWIINNFPNNYQQLNYIETCLGGGSVLLNKLPSKIEIANDLNKSLIDLWVCIKNNEFAFRSFLSRIEYTEDNFIKALKQEIPLYLYGWAGPHTRIEYKKYAEELVSRRFSRGGLKKTFAKSNRLRGGQMGDKNAWETFINKQIPKISKRIIGVEFTNKSCLEIIKEYNYKDNLVFIDPPWLETTRVAKKAYGEFEMSVDQHIELLDTIVDCKSSVVILGYPSLLYDGMLKERRGWHHQDKSVASHAGQTAKKVKKLISLWKNFI